MIVRLAANAIILIGCAYVGIMFATSLKKRVSQLEELQHMIKQMEFDIDFLNTPLCESLRRISGMCRGGVKDVVEYVSFHLSENKCVDMHAIWKKALERFDSELALTDEDKKIILDFSKNLGCGDRIREKNNIEAAAMRLSVAETEARSNAAKNVKMYRGLGILTGILIVIILF